MRSFPLRACYLFSFIFVLFSPEVSAQSRDVDWKLYGGLENQVCFYEASGLARPAVDHVRVWIKCMLRHDLDRLIEDKKRGKRVIDAAARKIVDHYQPPIILVQELEFNDIISIIALEVAANQSETEPLANIYYDLDCTNRMMRELSISIRKNGKVQSSEGSPHWKYAPPETNGDRLLKILCSM